jgi:hypothetical protein
VVRIIDYSDLRRPVFPFASIGSHGSTAKTINVIKLSAFVRAMMKKRRRQSPYKVSANHQTCAVTIHFVDPNPRSHRHQRTV